MKVIKTKIVARVLIILLPIIMGSWAALNAQTNQLSDDDIALAIQKDLIFSDAVNAHLVDVDVSSGIVTLSGSVDNILAKERAARIAESIKGVKSVVNNIQVMPIERSDAQIKADVNHALLNNPATESFEINVSVDHAEVTLSGSVQSWAERRLAEDVTKGVKGIRKVDNKLSIDYEKDRSDLEIKNEIQARLDNSIWIDAALIDVTVQNGDVTLSGTVGSAAEKRWAANKAWVSGVESVENDQIEVKWWARDEMKRKQKYAAKSDQEIKQAIKDAFIYDPRIYSFNTNIDVEDGIVTLTGTVDNLEAKKAAKQDAQNTIGTLRVMNYIKVRPETRLSDEELKDKVENALLLDPVVERYEIDITAINSKVYLNGRLNSDFEKQRAESVAAEQEGVIDIANNLVVDETWEPKSDWAIKEDIQDELFWSPFVDDEDINITVEGGRATLSGTVDTKFEAQSAVKNAYQAGARTVENNMDVEYGISQEQMLPEIDPGSPYYGPLYGYWY